MLNDKWYYDGWTNDQWTHNDWTHDSCYNSEWNDDNYQLSNDAQTTNTVSTNVVPNTALTCDDIKPIATTVRSESEPVSDPLRSFSVQKETEVTSVQSEESIDEVIPVTNDPDTLLRPLAHSEIDVQNFETLILDPSAACHVVPMSYASDYPLQSLTDEMR